MSTLGEPCAGGYAIVIGIPTFRRPQMLGALLESLLPELITTPCHIIIADNECGTEVPRIVEAFRAHWPAITCCCVAERGTAAVRNELVRQANVLAPGWHWLVMLDDNSRVCQGWLHSLLAVGERFDAHAVGGPIKSPLPADASRLARKSLYARRRSWPTGIVSILNGAHNLAISRKTISLIGEPLFCPEFGESGGEDYEFFRHVGKAQGRFAWCEEAVVVKVTAAERLTAQALLYRYASTGTYMSIIDRTYDGALKTWLRAIRGIVKSSGGLLLAALTLQLDKAARSLLHVAHYAGTIAGLLGVRTHRYTRTAP